MTTKDYAIAQRILIRQAQSQNLTIEGNEKWSLFLSNTDNLWRVGGRLAHAELTEDGKYPVYLPKGHHLTNLIISNQHEKLIHAGITHTLSQLKRGFWILRGRAAVKSVISKCMTCKRWKAKPFKLPAMPNLPESRLIRSGAFEKVDLDYLGPITIKIPYKMIKKRWIALFICFTTRAVHLEMVENLSSEDCYHVFSRFTARRGFPKLVLSDNAGQVVFKIIMEQNANFMAEEGIVWRKSTMGRWCIRKDYRIPIKNNEEDEEYTPYPLRTKNKVVECWKQVLKTLDVFWNRWRDEYLSSLRKRTQREIVSPRAVETREPQENEVVLLAESEKPRAT
ncbi:unnamed protein product [Onchocerca ochengi]|uniref:Integrase_H2C2 domain-containing protein n=1 Tax=Onchocerca ochengi TaxID=42157 RepID=A0A182ENF8_ONCOC|nr:unnamed protein product [Onchocerca ochengi]